MEAGKVSSPMSSGTIWASGGSIGREEPPKVASECGESSLRHEVPSQGGSLVARKALPWLRRVYHPWWSEAWGREKTNDGSKPLETQMENQCQIPRIRFAYKKKYIYLGLRKYVFFSLFHK